MKKLVTIVIVFVLIMCGYALAQTQITQQTGNVSGQQTTNVQGPGFANANAGGGDAKSDAAAGAYSGSYLLFDYAPTSIMNYPEYRLGAVSPGIAPLPWPYPPQYWLWNGLRDTRSLIVYHNRIWTLEEVDEALKRVKPNGILEGVGCILSALLPKGPEDVVDELRLKGFDWEISLNDYKLRPKNKLFRTIIDVNFPELSKDYVWMGAMGVTGCEKRLTDQIIRCAVRVALVYDLDFGLITPGINPVNSAIGASSGVGYTTAGVTNNLSLVGSVSGGKAYVEGRPGVGVIFFRKNGHPNLAKNIAEQLAKPPTEEKKPVEVQIIPETEQVTPKTEDVLKKGEVNGKLRGQVEEKRIGGEDRLVTPMMRDIWKRAAGG